MAFGLGVGARHGFLKGGINGNVHLILTLHIENPKWFCSRLGLHCSSLSLYRGSTGMMENNMGPTIMGYIYIYIYIKGLGYLFFAFDFPLPLSAPKNLANFLKDRS